MYPGEIEREGAGEGREDKGKGRGGEGRGHLQEEVHQIEKSTTYQGGNHYF